MLASIHSQQSLLNCFDLEFKSETGDDPQHKKTPTKKRMNNILLNKTCSIAVNPIGRKQMCTNRFFVLVAEQNIACKLFTRSDGQLVTTVTYSPSPKGGLIPAKPSNYLPSIGELNRLSSTNIRLLSRSPVSSASSSPVLAELYDHYSNVYLNDQFGFYSRSNENLKRAGKINNDIELVQSVCVDAYHNIFVAYNYSIDSFNDKGKCQVFFDF